MIHLFEREFSWNTQVLTLWRLRNQRKILRKSLHTETSVYYILSKRLLVKISKFLYLNLMLSLHFIFVPTLYIVFLILVGLENEDILPPTRHMHVQWRKVPVREAAAYPTKHVLSNDQQVFRLYPVVTPSFCRYSNRKYLTTLGIYTALFNPPTSHILKEQQEM